MNPANDALAALRELVEAVAYVYASDDSTRRFDDAYEAARALLISQDRDQEEGA